jgi:hypothetical protein
LRESSERCEPSTLVAIQPRREARRGSWVRIRARRADASDRCYRRSTTSHLEAGHAADGVSDSVVDAATGRRRELDRSADSILIGAPTADPQGGARSLTRSEETR